MGGRGGGEACLRFIQNIPGNLRVDSVGKETCIKTNVIFEVSIKKKKKTKPKELKFPSFSC